MKFLVTGSTGFIGRQLCDFLLAKGHWVRAAVRQPANIPAHETVICGDIDAHTDWSDMLRGLDAVIHLASPAHRQRRDSALFHRVIVAASLNLARQMIACEVPRLIFLSTLHVNGEQTTKSPFSRNDTPHPVGIYAESKYLAEQTLTKACDESELELVIIRSPLVHGPHVKGNLRLLMRAIRGGVPFPLRLVRNERSMVGIHNLCDFLETCARHPVAAKKIYLISDDEDISTPSLIRHLGELSGHPARLWPCPVPLLRVMGRALGRAGQVRRLCDSLQADITHARNELNWQPPRSLCEGLREMCDVV